MADEGTPGLKRASRERDDEEPDKEELQRRMEEARESISQTVLEIKETVTNQYYSVKESVSDALDWRHHFRQRPIAFSVGALSVGFLLGYTVAGALKGEGNDRDEQYSSEEYDDPNRHSAFHGHSYAAQPITDSHSEFEAGSSDEDERDASSESRQPGALYNYSSSRGEEDTEQKRGLLERFKGTSAYDRLQSEVSTLGDRFIDELATTAHTIVLPLLFKKIKELIGVDLSDKKDQKQPEQGGKATESRTSPPDAKAGDAPATSPARSAASASGTESGSSYATSENRGYGAGASVGDSVLDLDR